jgi:hypothetical protein
MDSGHVRNRFAGHWRFIVAILVCLLLASGTAVAQGNSKSASMPKNISPGLQHLLQHLRTGQPVDLSRESYSLDMRTGKVSHQPGSSLKMIYDANNRVLVSVHLNGQMTLDQMRQAIEQGGSRVTAHSANFGKGIIDAYMPLGAVEPAARLSGTGSIRLAYRPWLNVGATTSQGTIVMRTGLANTMGFDGTGTTVGVMSDSYNTSQFAGLTTTTALQDVGTGDLPNNTSVPGCEGLKYCDELDPMIFGGATDEGRGMAQIVHDVAPGANLCFGTAFAGELQFALNILDLAFNPQCAADVITDDVIYFDEPMFSDGIVAQAAQIVHDNGVAYFSSAGNQSFSGYSSPLRIIPDGMARSLPGQAVNLNTITPSDQDGVPIDTTGGFHNFNPDPGPPILSQLITVSNPIFSFQWDDPYGFVDNMGNPLVTTDLDLLFFHPTSGQFLFAINTDNFNEDFPIELFQLNGSGSLRLVISRKGTNLFTGQAATNLATQVRYVVFGNIAGNYIAPTTPTTFGHSCAAGANGVAAYRYNEDPAFSFNVAQVPETRAGNTRPELEYFSSPGPVQIFFDLNGNRLAQPQLRQKPDMAAPDGVNTTFFPQPELGGSDYEALYGMPDGFPNFFGTSAAAPHAAGVAALLIQKAGGPGTLSPDAVHKALINSAPARDFDFFFSKAAGSAGGATVQLSAGDPEFLNFFSFTNAGFDPNFFTLNFSTALPGVQLSSLMLDLSNTGLNFSPGNFPVTQSTSSGGVHITSSTPGTLSPTITINFSGYSSGKSVKFGVYRRYAVGGHIVGTGGKAADMISGGTFTATLSNGQTVSGTISNRIQKGYNPLDGFGLIDAVTALSAINSHH